MKQESTYFEKFLEDDDMKNRRKFGLLLNKIVALVLVLIGLVSLKIMKDATILVFASIIAVPMFLTNSEIF